MAPISPEQFVHILYEVQNHVAIVTINRPERRNALNWRAYEELESVFAVIHADLDVRCVVITGADPAFCSGDDVKEIMGSSPPDQVANRTEIRIPPTPAGLAVIECDRPVIAAINGAAVGWGMELALLADIRVASERAVFAELFIKRGLVSDMGGFLRLPAIVGPAKAAELLFTGDPIDAAEASRIGLVGDVVPHEQLRSHAMALAGRIAANPPTALRYMKEGLRRATYGNPREMGSWANETIFRLMLTQDHKEGVQSFIEKRPPVFTGR